VPYYDRGVMWNKLKSMHSTTSVISHWFVERKGSNIIHSILMIHVQKIDYWLEIEIYVL